MLFNIHHGQMRPDPGNPGQMYFRNCSPKKALIFAPLRVGGEKVRYDADALGNIDVRAPQHVRGMMQLGWPIYDGDGCPDALPVRCELLQDLERHAEGIRQSHFQRHVRRQKKLRH